MAQRPPIRWSLRAPASILLTLQVASAISVQTQDCSYASLYPKQYVCYKTAELNAEAINGDITKPAWQEVPWTDDFIDISTGTTPRFRTRAKMRWDDEHLYVAAELMEPQVWGTLTQDDTVIFQDNDFEVFVDPNGTTHFYKEFEMNALNSRWSLRMSKPYSDGGSEDSSRVDKDHGWSMLPRTKSAVRVEPAGSLNDPSRPSKSWTVEIALPLKDLANASSPTLPQHGTFWRISFSRVEWNTEVNASNSKYKKVPKCQSCPEPGAAKEDNWVWTSQREVNMHLPERWGILQFSDQKPGATAPAKYDRWPSQAAAMAVYYAQKKYAQANNGTYTTDVHELQKFSAPPFEMCTSAEVSITRDQRGQSGFEATVSSPDVGPWAATITEDRFLTVARHDSKKALKSDSLRIVTGPLRAMMTLLLVCSFFAC